MFEVLSYRTERVRWHTLLELCASLNALRATRILSVSPCLPDATDTARWSSVYYEYRVR